MDETVLASTCNLLGKFQDLRRQPITTLSGLPYNSLDDQPEDLTFLGFIFAGCNKDADCTDGEEWDFVTERITKDTAIDAKWEQDEDFLHELRFKAEGFDDMVIIAYDGDSIDNVPAVPQKEGYSGEWDGSDFTNIQQDILVNAIYTAPAGSDVDLTSLTGSIGNLTPAFAPDTSAYTVDVDHEVASIDDTATLADENASLTIGGFPATSGVPETVSLKEVGTPTIIDITVDAEDGETQRTYTITVNRAAAPEINPIRIGAWRGDSFFLDHNGNLGWDSSC